MKNFKKDTNDPIFLFLFFLNQHMSYSQMCHFRRHVVYNLFLLRINIHLLTKQNKNKDVFIVIRTTLSKLFKFNNSRRKELSWGLVLQEELLSM